MCIDLALHQSDILYRLNIVKVLLVLVNNATTYIEEMGFIRRRHFIDYRKC